MAITNFIPEVWSANILENFHNQGVLVDLANRTYEQEFTAGSTLHIPGIVDIKVKDYKAAGRTTSPDEVTDTGIDITIDQEKNFDFYVDDIDVAQANGAIMASYTASAASALQEDSEAFLTGLLTAGGTKLDDAATVSDYASAYAAILKIRQALTAAKIPQQNRHLIVNAAFETFLLGADSTLAKVNLSGGSEGLREATIGRLLGFNVVVNPFNTETKAQAIGLYAPALAYVSQISETEAMRGTNKFADRVRGLHVYGGKVLRPTGVQIVTNAA